MRTWTIAWKDTLIRFRDRNALLLNLAAPLILSAIMGAAFGGLTGDDDTPISDIPFVIINDDQGEFGQSVVDVLTSDELDKLLEPTIMTDLEQALKIIEVGDTRAIVYIPANFSNAIRPANPSESNSEGSTIQLYTDPAVSITPTIIRGIVTEIATRFNTAAISTNVTVEQLTTEHARTLGPALVNLGAALEAELGLGDGSHEHEGEGAQINLNLTSITTDEDNEEDSVNVLAFFAPSMAIFFLMFAMVDGSRSILDERIAGTLDRLRSTPTGSSEILLGKIGGTFLTGILQMAVLVVASRIIFNLSWGHSPSGLILMIAAVVAAATSLGTFIASFAKQPNQAQIVGSAVALIFAVFGGNFVPAENLPDALPIFSRLTINRWALDGFSDLAIDGLGFGEILPEAGVLLGDCAGILGNSLPR